ncbi:uncharacterized protein si:dkey-92i15.4 [Melanotaenia boesemani]|uniref:uncharacterized protein si:dkey-92i15.4 n=1 Tax=Melanotaenia boesemani TaxID=1250792 RepID=UPI001C0595C2|nr:uncharacterized protein si:dkey-92i15.4 [Melanotaenia boesemani]XP_041844189.1 uncharacterized protein si:dkey-92i15.4 [Melanotaenia boesemani]XP_041844190.1 uncharacterized protein si:dkey-92i15.4 [Melanotaenia boesemani]XP_041844191.1 uncharacterized protein si:dkey-92i15.4 [Melanotaenia boesemani]
MDLSLVPSGSEYNKQRTGTRFTVRSANSPSYSLTRRPGIKKRETAEDVGETERHGTHTDTIYTNKEEDAVTGYQSRKRSCSAKDQSEEKDASSYQTPMTKTISDSGSNKRENPVFESRGRTEWRRQNIPSRSKSLDWRTGARSPTRGTRTDTSILPAKRGAELREHARDLAERTVVENGLTDRMTSSLQNRNSAGASYAQNRNPVNQTSQTLNWTSRGQSLPSRLRSESRPGLRFAENLFGPKGGQSIQERIEKLFGTGEKAAGGTFPRRLSSGESNSPVESRISLIWPQKYIPESETSLSPRATTFGEKAVMGQLKSRYPEEANWGKGWMVESGTKSLDRARSRHTLAARIRSARAAGGTGPCNEPNTFLEETFRDSSGFREQRANGAMEERETGEGATEETERKSDVTDEDVFETNPQKITLKTAETKKFTEVRPAPSATSVKNKISQFEALTQRAAGQISMSRRTLSVPTQHSKVPDGVKKSMSVKEIIGQRDKWDGLKRCREENTVEGKGKKHGAERSLSVDEVGLGLERTKTGGNDLLGENKNNFSEDFGKYSRLKSTLQLPLNEGAQRCSRKFNIDETDFSKVSSSDKSSKRDVTANNASSPQSSSVQPRQHCDMTSPVNDDNKTPTNTPSDSPFMSPAQPENTTFITEKKNKNTSDATQACKAEDPDSTSLPFKSSFYINPSDLSANVKTANQKGKKQVMDLTAWIAGLNQDYDCWNVGEKDYEDDDESTQRDEDSNYDSDSGDSSVTITSNMSQSDRRSYSLSLSDLCNFVGAEYESDNDIDEGQQADRRSASLSSDLSAYSCVSLLPSEELDRLLQDVKTLGDDTLQEYDDVQVVVLHKEVGVGLGFSLAGGADQNKPIVVHKVFHSGVAAQEGSIREGDHVLSINGTALSGSAHWEALRILRKAKTQNMGVVVLRRSDVSCALKIGVQENNEGTTQTQYETGQCVCVQLQKNSRDLGFSLQGGVGSSEGNRPLTVQKIFQGGPVDKVYSGDQVLEIQGISMTGMRRLEAWTFIKSLPPGPVEVVLHRPIKHLQA